ncbi:hypothetical protein MUG78_17050 [Gordonia alkaliphila]|uniref:hypothetical protein n=1 Tax=Gordonia alkaliphila TaxID=1053547 RepID=UPI001FF1185D|nr:hypothetical protein [Gordonia alkaliphila]MCK0441109.1 hypothetical protein [Gordonia alkaliphila]
MTDYDLLHKGVRHGLEHGKMPTVDQVDKVDVSNWPGLDEGQQRSVYLLNPGADPGLAQVYDSSGNPVFMLTKQLPSQAPGGQVHEYLTPVLTRPDGAQYILRADGEEQPIAKGFNAGDLATRQPDGTFKYHAGDGGPGVIPWGEDLPHWKNTDVSTQDALDANSTLIGNRNSNAITNSLNKLGVPASFQGQVATAAHTKLGEFRGTAQKFDAHELDFRREIAIFAARTTSYNTAFGALQSAINQTQVEVTRPGADTATQMRAGARFKALMLVKERMQQQYRGECQRVITGCEKAFDNYKDTPASPRDRIIRLPGGVPPAGGAPQAPGGSSAGPGGSGSSSGSGAQSSSGPTSGSPSSSSPGSSPSTEPSSASTKSADDIMSKIQSMGQPVSNPAMTPMAGMNPMARGMAPGGLAPAGPVSAGGPGVMSDDDFNSLLARATPSSAISTTPSSSSLSGSGGMPPLSGSGQNGGSGSGTKQPPSQNLSSPGTRPTGTTTTPISDANSAQNGRGGAGMPMMPMMPMGGAPGGGGGGGGAAKRETGLKGPEADIANHIGHPVITTTPVVNDPSNKSVHSDQTMKA